MDGKPFMAGSFATTLRRKLFRGILQIIKKRWRSHTSFTEHLGLIPPQSPSHNARDQKVAANMKPAPHPYDYDFGTRDDALVADPVAESTMQLWQQTAKKNREIYTELFRTVPNNIVRNWDLYEVRTASRCFLTSADCTGPQQYVPKVRTGHVAPGVTLDRVKQRLSQVRGQLVECPLVRRFACRAMFHADNATGLPY